MNAQSTILCIDDEQPALLVRKQVLESAGYRVLTARSGAEGIRVFSNEPVDVVVLDYWMADMKGLAVADELKRIRPGIPILMLSAFSPILDEAIGKADAWLTKGEIDPKQMLDMVGKLISDNR
jgi:two-component system, OmpR family, response regulator CpxR